MDYHKDRFEDYSLLIYNEKTKLVAVYLLIEGRRKRFFSHQGLTYGGLIFELELKLR
jgi:hypothetical protein